ncbi:integron integrase [Desulforhopalus vacuolatus]|uniref:integron integrase n=1 Tax=Desulforhopalus vacuolatus TaxID=40414 RepID=UPI001962DC74|nr:integron integrase [Desulforhopalus vacuolatus]MBM9518605.1 integron integrase [Desulforhopalus vacuolatus]
MLVVPADVRIRYADFLDKKGIALQHIYKCQKYLRYYLDFCQKYRHEASTVQGLEVFLLQLAEKKKDVTTRKEAERAVQLYQEYLVPGKNEGKSQKNDEITERAVNVDKYITRKDHNRDTVSSTIVTKPAEKNIDRIGSSWKYEFTELENTIRMRHYSDKTLKSYRKYIRDFQTYTESPQPDKLTAEHVKNYLTHLAVKKKVSASTQNLAFNSLLFFFRHVLNREFGTIDGVVRARKRPYIPVVLSRVEIEKIFQVLDEPYLLVVKLLYGCGLRLFECLSLRVHCLNLEEGILTVHNGKGKKDRTVPLPKSLYGVLREQLDTVYNLHSKDIARGYNGVFLFDADERESKNASRQFIWQWLFPAHKISRVKKTGAMKRFHLHETHVQKALRQAVKKACLTKRVTAHTFRHSYASHLLQANYDIRTIQELLGHSDVRTTMIYTHTVKSTTKREVKSPLDF